MDNNNDYIFNLMPLIALVIITIISMVALIFTWG